MSTQINNIWEGIYEDFKSAPAIGRGHEGDKWIEIARERSKELLRGLKISGAVSEVGGFRENLLPFLVSIVGSIKNKVSVLDFGGAIGTSYIPTIAVKPKNLKVDFHIVELPEVAKEGKKLFKNYVNIHFYSELPKILKPVDIINIGSSIQYVDDWKGLLKSLASYNPKYFLMTQIFAGNIPTYITLQNYYDSKITFRFLNINELIRAMDSLEYSLSFKARFIPTFMGKEQEYPQNNFPSKYKLKRSCTLLFAKKSD